MADVRVLYHAQCFDGFASAAVFSRFYSDCISATASYAYRGLRHGGTGPLDEHIFDHPVNAIVDFRYSPSAKLHWWFDHHCSAFESLKDRDTYMKRATKSHHWDPEEPSCAGFMVRRLRSIFDVELQGLDSLAVWADKLDSAKFQDAAQVVELNEPVHQLMTVCEHLQDGHLAERVIDAMAGGLVEDIAVDADIKSRFLLVFEDMLRGQAVVESLYRTKRDVVIVDLADSGPVTVNKFLAYYLEPDCTYVVSLVRGRHRGVQLSVGSNPWRSFARRHDIASICQMFGGGGHAVVGGICLPNATVEQGRVILNKIVDLLTASEAK